MKIKYNLNKNKFSLKNKNILLKILCMTFVVIKPNFQAMLPANVDDLSRILNRFGVALNGMSNGSVDRLKKTVLPKYVVTFDVFAKKVDMNDKDKIIVKELYEQVRI